MNIKKANLIFNRFILDIQNRTDYHTSIQIVPNTDHDGEVVLRFGDSFSIHLSRDRAEELGKALKEAARAKELS